MSGEDQNGQRTDGFLKQESGNDAKGRKVKRTQQVGPSETPRYYSWH